MKSKNMELVYIVKHALTDGVFAVMGDTSKMRGFCFATCSKYLQSQYYGKGEWFYTEEEASKAVINMCKDKLKNIEADIKQAEELITTLMVQKQQLENSVNFKE